VDVLASSYDKQMQRQIALAERLFEERQALKKARKKELLLWEYFAGGTIVVATVYYGLKKKNKFAFIPTVPIVMLVGYHHEQCSEEFDKAVRKHADRIFNDPAQRAHIRPIGGAITLKELDERRKRWASSAVVNE